MFSKFLVLTLKSIRFRPIRSWLTIIGIIIGIMLVVLIMSLSTGIENVISQKMKMFGSDWIAVFPGKETSLASLASNEKFREKDLMDLQNVKGVKLVVPENTGVMTIENNGEKKSVMIHATPWTIKEFFEEGQGMKLIAGQWPESEDAREIVIGYKVAKSMFKNKVKIGDEITVKSKKMRVAAIVGEVGAESDNVVYVSLQIYYALTNSPREAGAASIKAEKGYNLNEVAARIKHQLSKQEVVRDFTVLTPEKASRMVGDILGIIELFLIIIALISLIVGAVGIMNTMYTSVLERTKDIGVMKAIGATNEAVLSLFLIESGMIGLLGGLIGSIMGVFLAYISGAIAEKLGVTGLFSFASLDFLGFLAVLMITFVTGIISGILPARQAAKMEPAEALRYE